MSFYIGQKIIYKGSNKLLKGKTFTISKVTHKMVEIINSRHKQMVYKKSIKSALIIPDELFKM